MLHNKRGGFEDAHVLYFGGEVPEMPSNLVVFLNQIMLYNISYIYSDILVA